MKNLECVVLYENRIIMSYTLLNYILEKLNRVKGLTEIRIYLGGGLEEESLEAFSEDWEGGF